MASPVLILPPRYTSDSIAMWRAAIKVGWRTERLTSWRAPQELSRERVVFYGEPLFAAAIAQELGLALIEPTFDWLTSVPEHYLHRRIEFATLSDARKLTAPAFVKPADEKCFHARVYASGGELPSEAKLDGTTPVLIAEPVTWEVEYRCFVRDRTVRAISPYIRNGEIAEADDGTWPATPEEREAARSFADRVLGDDAVPMPPATVLDVGLIDDRGWAVVEANPAWGSGLCACDPEQVLTVLDRACLQAKVVSPTDAEWVRKDED